ncbi:3-oxoacyl-[acyl-carrier-protein] synthase II, chloroplastic-like [Fagus crenata]
MTNLSTLGFASDVHNDAAPDTVFSGLISDLIQISDCLYQLLACSDVHNDAAPDTVSSGLISDLIQRLDCKLMRFCCRVISIHILVLEQKWNGLITSFEPCNPYYTSNALFSVPFTSLFRSNNVSFNRRHRRFDRVIHSGDAMAVASKEVATKKKRLTKQRQVVVTGMGMVTPLGHDPDIFNNNLLEGVSGISEIEAFDCAQFSTVNYI